MMRKIIITITIVLIGLSAHAQFNYPIGTPTWYKKVRVDSVFWLNTVDTVHQYAVLYPGSLMSRLADTSLYISDGEKWVKVGKSAADLSNYYTKTQLQTSGQSQVHWGNITNTPTTLGGYGISNAYAKIETDTLFLKKRLSQIFPYDSSYQAPPSKIFAENSNYLEFVNMGNFIRSPIAFEQTPMGIVRGNWSLLGTNNMIYDSTYQGWNVWNTNFPSSCFEAGFEGITFHYVPKGFASFTNYPHEGLQIRGGIDGTAAIEPDSQYIQIKTTVVGKYDTAFDAGSTAYGWGYSRRPFTWLFSEYPTKQLQTYNGTGNIYSMYSQYTSTATSAPIFGFERSRGTFASKTAVQTGDTIGNFKYFSYDGSKFLNTGRIYALATANATANNATTNITTVASNGNATTGTTTLTSTGRLGINTTGPLGVLHTVKEGFNGAWYNVRYAAGQTNVPPASYGVASRGTVAAPTTVLKGDVLHSINATAYDGTSFDFVSRGAVQIAADTTFTPSVKSTRFDVLLTNILDDGRRVFSVDHNGHGAFADTTTSERLYVDGAFRANGYITNGAATIDGLGGASFASGAFSGNTIFAGNGAPGAAKFAKGTDGAGNWTWQTLAAADLPTGSANYVQVQTGSSQAGGFRMAASSFIIGTANTAFNIGQTTATGTNTASINIDAVDGNFSGLDYLGISQTQAGNAVIRNNNSSGTLVLGSGGSASANITLSTGNATAFGGAVAFAIVSTSGNRTLTSADRTILITNTAHAVTLPTANTVTGREYILVNYNTGGNSTISSVLRDGAAVTLLPNNAKWTVQSDGTNWYVIKD